MSAENSDFGKGKVPNIILRLGLPIIAAEFVNVLYNIVDRMYIGHLEGVGTEALTGIGVAFPLITLIGAFANLCGTGGVPLSSIARGKGDNESARKITETAFTMLLIIGVFLTGLMYGAAPRLLAWLGGNESTLSYAVDYFRIYVIGTVPVLIGIGMNPFINSQGFSVVGMMTVIIGAFINIVLDPLFIYTLKLGVKGAAIATVISQTISAIWIVSFLCGKRPVVRIQNLRLDKNVVGEIIKLGITGFTFKVTNSVTQALVNITLKTFGGALSTLYIGSMSVINSLREVTSLPTSGVTTGAQPVMSYNYGARKYKRVSEAIRFMLFSSLIINSIMWLIVMIFPEKCIGLFSPDEELINTAVQCIRIYFGVFPLMALQLTGQNTFVALNKPKFALFFSMFRKFILVAPLTIILPRIGFGANGVFWAEFISQFVGANACFITMYFTVWRKLDKNYENCSKCMPVRDKL